MLLATIGPPRLLRAAGRGGVAGWSCLHWCQSSRAAEGRALRRRGNQSTCHSAGRPGANARPMRGVLSELRRLVFAAVSARAPFLPRRCTSVTSASVRSRSPTTTTRSRRHVTRERIAAGPPTIWRYADLLPVADARSRSTSVPDAPRWCEPTGSPRNSGSASSGSKTTPQPDRLVQGPGRVGRPHKGPRARLQGRRLRLDGNLANSVAAHAARAGMESVVLRAPRSRAGEDRRRRPSTAATSSPSTATTTTSTGSARSSRASTRPGRS